MRGDWAKSGKAASNAVYSASPVIVAHHSAAQTISTTPTNILFNSELNSDYFSLHSTTTNTHRFVCSKAGQATVEFNGKFAVNAVGAVGVYKHSAAGGGSEALLGYQEFGPFAAGRAATAAITKTALCSLPGDYFYVQAEAAAGTFTLDAVNFGSPTVTFKISR